MPIRISIHILLSVCYFFILQKLILQKYANELSIKALIRSYKAILDVKECFGKLFISFFEYMIHKLEQILETFREQEN